MVYTNHLSLQFFETKLKIHVIVMQSFVFSSTIVKLQNQRFHLSQILHKFLLNILENSLTIAHSFHILAYLMQLAYSHLQLWIDSVQLSGHKGYFCLILLQLSFEVVVFFALVLQSCHFLVSCLNLQSQPSYSLIELFTLWKKVLLHLLFILDS